MGGRWESLAELAYNPSGTRTIIKRVPRQIHDVPWYNTLRDYTSYTAARQSFDWSFPDGFNAAYDCVRKHDDCDSRPALFLRSQNGGRRVLSFRDLDIMSNQLANYFHTRGLKRGDRVAIQVSQKPAAIVGHLACWKLGLVSVPCSILLGDDGLSYRLNHSGATAMIVDSDHRETLRKVRNDCNQLKHIVETGSKTDVWIGIDDVYERYPSEFDIVATDAKTPATILYTSGTTSEPKGVLHSHGFWVGNTPVLEMCFEHDINQAIGWTPVDWSWNGALGSLIFPLFHYGRPVVGIPKTKFNPLSAYEVLSQFNVSHAFIPPTALRLLRDGPNPEKFDLSLNVIAASGEPLTSEISEWVAEALPDVVLNELYGLTEASGIVSNCHTWFEVKEGSAGRIVPGHKIAIIDPDTREELSAGEEGEIAVRVRDDPAVFDEYWDDTTATAESVLNGWFLTGDLGWIDEDGYLWFSSRADNVIISSGYRISPYEIEDVLYQHPNVAEVGVVGVTDEVRGKIVKAFVKIETSQKKREELEEELREWSEDG